MKRLETDQQLLPDDLIGEILSHLPIPAISKFRCVSKSWINIIDSSSFAQSHLRNYCNTPTSSSTDNDSCVFIRDFEVGLVGPARFSTKFLNQGFIAAVNCIRRQLGRQNFSILSSDSGALSDLCLRQPLSWFCVVLLLGFLAAVNCIRQSSEKTIIRKQISLCPSELGLVLAFGC
ncbi:hypothetical protein CASFOL_017779 [Castilleja foliolosa]|uniref:F-box domain-containing protein n=1 Tax=Castilleja foliolosa TaxID=1961234 RepID=A0ABD3D871_9LAMI